MPYRSIEELAAAVVEVSGAEILPFGRYGIRCCYEGDWFVYYGDDLILPEASYCAGYGTCEQAVAALGSHLRRRPRDRELA